MSSSRPWTVLPHGPIEHLESNLWTVVGSGAGLPLQRRMTLIKLEDGRVVIHSCMALEEGAMQEIEAWGAPAFLLVPNGMHRLDAPAYKKRYPELQVLCPANSMPRIRQVVSVDGDYRLLPVDPALQIETLAGVKSGEAVFIVKSSAPLVRTSLIFNDAIFNHPHVVGFQGWLMRLIGSTGGPRVTPLFRSLEVRDRQAFKAHLLRLAQLPQLARILVSHGQVIEHQAAEILRAVANF